MLWAISYSTAHLLFRQWVVNVLVIKTTFEYFGYNRCNSNESIIFYFMSIVFLWTGLISGYFWKISCFNNFINNLRQIHRKYVHYLALLSRLGGAAILVSNFLISFAITSLSTGTNKNLVRFLKYCFILKNARMSAMSFYCAQ